MVAPVLLVVFLLSSCIPESSSISTATPSNLPTSKRVVGYYAQWAAERGYFVSSIPAARITQINYAFSNVSDQGKCILGDSVADVERVYTANESVSGNANSAAASALHGNFNQLLELKAKYPNLKVLISIGGWSWSDHFSAAALTEASRQAFVQSCIDLYFKQYKGVFDGIDIDWEYPVSGGLTAGRPEDKHNFTLLLAELRRELDSLGSESGKHYLLSIAAPVGPGISQKYERSEIIQYLDWINLMAYDIHGTWEGTTNFNAPLYQSSADPSDASLNVDAAVQDYLSSGIPAEKLNLGVPFYGHGWKGVPSTNNGLYASGQGAADGKYGAGSFDYTELVSGYLPTYTRYWDVEAQVPWLYNPATGIFISYDDPQSIAAKAGYAMDKGLGGVMIWELSEGNDDLLGAIQTGFQNGGIPRIRLAGNPNATPVPRPYSAEIHAVSGIKIDGKLDDWPTDPTFTLNDKSQVAYSLHSDSWGGQQDLSGQIWVGWAAEGLYFAVKVVDDIHVQTSSAADLWHGDYAEWQFDTQLDKDYATSTMNDDDYQIGVSVGDFGSVPPVAYAWFNGPNAPGVIKIQQAQVQTPDGYILEIFIPKELLNGISLAEGATFGMNVSLSDADSVAQGQKVILSTSAIRTYADPRTFGKITLVK